MEALPDGPQGLAQRLLDPMRRGDAEKLRKMKNDRKRNVTMMYWHVFAIAMFQSVCQWNLFDAYLSFLAVAKGFDNKNTWVGFAECITGMTTLILAIPLGILVDNFDRIVLVRIAALIGLLASVISFGSFATDNIPALYSNLLLWGLFTGLVGTAAEAIFADSIEKGKRSAKTTMKGMLSTAGLALGPGVMLFLFLYIGDEWTLKQLHVPLLMGCIFGPLACVPLVAMRDPQPGMDEDTELGRRDAEVPSQLMLGPAGSPQMVPPASPIFVGRDRAGSSASPAIIEAEKRRNAPSGVTDEERFSNMSAGEKLIPFILTTADFITEVGAGMTVRFFPLFFISDYDVSPMLLCAIFGSYPLFVASSMPVCQWLSRKVGRAQASFGFQTLGIGMLVLMTYVQSLPLLIVVFMLRGQLQNAAYPIDRSILIDYIPSKNRGKWNSIASLTTMTWSGSAVLGGYLADRHDYRFTFLITAVIYGVGVTAYAPLLWLVPVVEGEDTAEAAAKRVRDGQRRAARQAMAQNSDEEEETTYRLLSDVSPLSVVSSAGDQKRGSGNVVIRIQGIEEAESRTTEGEDSTGGFASPKLSTRPSSFEEDPADPLASTSSRSSQPQSPPSG